MTLSEPDVMQHVTDGRLLLVTTSLASSITEVRNHTCFGCAWSW